MVRFLGSSRIYFHLPLVAGLSIDLSGETSRSRAKSSRTSGRIEIGCCSDIDRTYRLLFVYRFYKNFQRNIDIGMAIIMEERSCRDFRLDRFRRVFYSNPSRPTLRLKSHFDRLFEETTLECRI